MRLTPITAAAAVAVSSILHGGAAHAAVVDITNTNGTIADQFLSSNGGLDSDQFTVTKANGVSVWLRARNKVGDDPTVVGTTYKLDPLDIDPNDTNGFKFEFQFSPRDGDTTENSNYFIELALDDDPTAATSFGNNTFLAPIFSGDSVAGWDDGDSLVVDGVTDRTSGVVEFGNPTGDRDANNLPNYAIANSWTTGFGFLFGGAPGPGLYDLRLTAFDSDPTARAELASVQITAEVSAVPLPAPVLMLFSGVAGLGLLGARRRQAA